MALTLPRYVGRDLTVTCAGDRTAWKETSITFVEAEEDASAADSTQIESVNKRIGITGKCTGLINVDNNGGTLPAIGDTIDDFEIAAGSDTILPDLSAYTNIKVVAPINYNTSEGLATYEFNFKSGRLN